MDSISSFYSNLCITRYRQHIDKNSKYSLSQLNIINCYTVTCLDEISSEKIKITIEAGKCTDKPENKGEYKYEYNGKYYDKKING